MIGIEIGILVGVIALIVISMTKKNNLTEQNREIIEQLEKRLTDMENRLREEFKTNRQEMATNVSENRTELNASLKDNREELNQTLARFQVNLDRNIQSFNELQREKFAQMDNKQSEMILKTEQKLEQMRETVDEKLQKTLNERLGQSFETVSKQLLAVQDGLGEMKTLAQDVGGLKKVLSNVKVRGTLGEVQLSMLLEQILAPDQFEANVRTKKGSSDLVEFAVKLPGRDDNQSHVYLPIDAKFPKEVYEKLLDAYESGDSVQVESAGKVLETTIKRMAKDISDKYIDPPGTTDFAILFLPFESIYAEVIRRSALLEQIQRESKVIVTGPTTLAAILNSLQMGFRTLALQKRSSEVWSILGAVKTEFEKFGGLLEKAQKNINTASDQIGELIGTRTNVIKRRLREVESLPSSESQNILGITSEEIED
ncbi:DNA recombination protein RmuC [Parabacteroides sp. FAFU027]|uniref:DNA recombination protein RmuC n=1 Tax=Parabacteroides sp. FAFU027 TaxID=2922715 RepID=UPI001FAF113D|nr:DNA recombination protein RmuC [Parabacteroides sp. FAFU027]